MLICILLEPLIVPLPGLTANANISEQTKPITHSDPTDFVQPVIYHTEAIDRDFDKIQDSLEVKIQDASSRGNDVLPVVVTLYAPVSSQDLYHFTMLGGNVTHIYEYVTYGFAGVIPAHNILKFAMLEKENLCIIEYDLPVQVHLETSVPLIRARPEVWNTYGYTGSPNQSIAIIDTGIDDSHPDVGPYGDLNFSRKIVGWYDATNDHSAAPEDYHGHGTHCAGIAAGTGDANSLQGSGFATTTWAYTLEGVPWRYGYLHYGFDVMNPGLITLNCTWTSGNLVVLQIRDTSGQTILSETSGRGKPLVLTYDATESGRYRPFVGIGGMPFEIGSGYFSLRQTYLYQGKTDGYNLFTGVAPTSKLVGVKVFDNNGYSPDDLSWILAGMDWVIANKYTYNITVASMSIGLENGGTNSTFDQKADTMVENGIVTCVSAGNDFPDYTIGSPATAAYVITVAATNDQNGITSYSSNGDSNKNEHGLVKPDVAAPGGSTGVGNLIISADSNDVDHEYSGQSDYTSNDYQQMAGTSMSTPHVAGLAALLTDALSSWSWTRDEALKVKMIISMTAFEVQDGEIVDGQYNMPPLNRGDKDNKEGYGRICADAAIEAVTMNYNIGESANAMLGPSPSDKKVWARQVELSAYTKYEFRLSVPSNADYDLYLYNGKPDSYGQPVILAKSVNASSGGEEVIQFIPDATDTYYTLVKWVSGGGTFDLQSSGTLVHDITIVDVAPSASKAYAGNLVNITVRVKNNGGAAETFNVIAYYDSNVIEMQTVTDLIAGAEKNLTFSWNTADVTPCNNYTIRVEASVVPDEIDTYDNVYVDGAVKIKIPGDVNGDGEVNLEDLMLIARALGTDPRYPPGTDWNQWNPDCDFNSDNKVDAYDLLVGGKNYGSTC